MDVTAITTAFEHAYYRYLADLPCRQEMVECGVDAILAGFEGTAVCRLAGADHDGKDELTTVFAAAAQEVGVSLPDPSAHRVWFLHKTEELEASGRAPIQRSLDQTFEDNVFMLTQRLRGSNNLDGQGSLLAFVRHLEQSPDDYQDWLTILVTLGADAAGETSDVAVRRIVVGLTDLTQARAFGATTPDHVEAVQALRRQAY